MLRNAAKANWFLEELGWSTTLAPVLKDWDGLLPWFLVAYERFEPVREHPGTRAWYRVAKNAT
jgi:hypothetical protein